MGIENLLLCGMAFGDKLDFSDFGPSAFDAKDSLNKIDLYNKSNDIGNSGYKTFLTDPQPSPLIEIKKPDIYASLSIEKPLLCKNSFNYVNQNNQLLGGITGFNSSEVSLLRIKHFGEK